LNDDGTVNLYHRAADVGQGVNTVMSQMLADLGLKNNTSIPVVIFEGLVFDDMISPQRSQEIERLCRSASPETAQSEGTGALC
jgi:hypothetical protein